MAGVSTGVTQEMDDDPTKCTQNSEETKKKSNQKKKDKKNKTDVTKKTVKFEEPEPKKPKQHRTRVFVSSREKLQTLKSKIYEVVRETEGIWCTDIVSLYRERFNKSPEFSALRFYSIIDLLRCMTDVLVIKRSKEYDNYWVCDANAPHPPPQKKEPEPEPEPEPVEEVPWWDPCPPEPPDLSALDEDALPGVPFASDVFPRDCIQPGDTIPNLELPELDSDYLEVTVYISAFYSPSHIWLRFIGEMYHTTIQEVIEDMTVYYEHGPGVHRRLCYAAMKVGYYCAAFHQNWHRALIVRIIDTDHAKVLLVDEGLVLELSIDDMKPLRRCWSAALPAQAVRARMVGVRPPDGAQLWPLLSCYQFNDQTRGIGLIASILAVHKAERVLDVYLRSFSTKERIKRKLIITEGIDQGTELIKTGYADPEPNSLPENGEIFSYYYPLFDVIESGATPSFHELDALSKQGFEPEDIPSYLKHVPPLEPIRCPTPPHLTADYEDLGFIDEASGLDPAMSGSSDTATALDPASPGSVTSDTDALVDAIGDMALSSVIPNPVPDPVPLDPVPLDSVPLDPVRLDSVPLDPVPLDSVPLDPVPLDSVPLDPVPLDSVPLDPVPLDSVPLDPVPLDSVPLDPVPLDSVPLDPVPLDSVPLDPVPLDSVPLDPVPLDSVPLDPVPLDSVPLDFTMPKKDDQIKVRTKPNVTSKRRRKNGKKKK